MHLIIYSHGILIIYNILMVNMSGMTCLLVRLVSIRESNVKVSLHSGFYIIDNTDSGMISAIVTLIFKDVYTCIR